MLPIPFAALPRDCPGNRSENRQCAQCKKTQPLLRKRVHKGAVKQENIGQFRPHSPRRRVGRPGRRHPACGQLPCARTNTAELGAAPLERADVPAGARKRWEAYLQRYASHRCECRCPKMPLHGDAFPRPPLSAANSAKAALRCAEGSGNARCTAKRQGGFLDTMAQTFQAGYLLEQSKKTSACSAAKRTPLSCLAAESQEKALPNKWPQTLHERRGCKKQLNSKIPRFVEAFINMGTTTQTHNENFSIMAVCIKFILLHLRC